MTTCEYESPQAKEESNPEPTLESEFPNYRDELNHALQKIQIENRHRHELYSKQISVLQEQIRDLQKNSSYIQPITITITS